jgi:aspartate 1-decarboxylase
MLKSKLHGATVTDANVDYVGSITLDTDLIEAAGLREYERVLVADLDNGERLETYVMPGESGVVGMNGAAARLVKVGDRIIVMSFVWLDKEVVKDHKPKIIYLDSENRITNQ